MGLLYKIVAGGIYITIGTSVPTFLLSALRLFSNHYIMVPTCNQVVANDVAVEFEDDSPPQNISFSKRATPMVVPSSLLTPGIKTQSSSSAVLSAEEVKASMEKNESTPLKDTCTEHQDGRSTK